MIKRVICFIPCLFLLVNVFPQSAKETFELRYFTNDSEANGETDFKGETEWLDTEGRINFLNQYANSAASFFKDPNLNRKLLTEHEIIEELRKIKPKPLTSVRQTLPLNSWKAYGYKEGLNVTSKESLDAWTSYKGTSILEKSLLLENAIIKREIDTLSWRFKFETKINIIDNSSGTISLGGEKNHSITIGFQNGKLLVFSDGKSITRSITNLDWFKLKIEADLSNKRFNLYVDENLLHDFILMSDTSISSITKLTIQTKGKVQLDDLFIFNHIPTDDESAPYMSDVVIDEHFEKKESIEGWQHNNYNDKNWETVNLPSVHGGIREKEEDYYLRKKVQIGDFERAVLLIESLDPGGEVWVNNQVVGVINNRYPVELDISSYLKPNSENLIAVKVKSYKLRFPMAHTPTDHYIGWSLGRTSLLLSGKCMIKQAQISTKKLANAALQTHKLSIDYPTKQYFEGSIEINYYPWFPEDGNKVATIEQEIQIRPRIINEYEFEIEIPSPQLWSPKNPNLYKVEFILKDKEGKLVDDFVTTTGIRTIEQKNGDLYINGKKEMLNGAQIMGFRTPVEDLAKYNRCPKDVTVLEELLMLKKMGANLLRIHVHAEMDTTDGINDPRYAEMADQLGIYLIWSTGAWTRSTEVWNVDFTGYPKFMKQVINHPSIVIWEAANHPRHFKMHGVEDTHDYVRRIVQTISSVDESRLISPTTFWTHTHYGNYDGTIDDKGNPIKAVSEYMHPLVTRGGQDAYSGYGSEWTKIRTAPNQWAESCLDAKDKAYFNFEHEESAAQPNWDLCKGKPWYQIQSYEWKYEEGSIGRKLSADEWRASQAYQAFSAWESMKKQVLIGYDGFSWCCLHGGPNMGTYQKPLIDNLCHPKLAFYVNRMIFQESWAGSNNVDVVYGPDDKITPVVNHLGEKTVADLVIYLKDLDGKTIDKKKWRGIEMEDGHPIIELDSFRFKDVPEGIYIVQYELIN